VFAVIDTVIATDVWSGTCPTLASRVAAEEVAGRGDVWF